MSAITVKNLENSDVAEIELDATVFEEPRHDHVVFEEIRRFRASIRAGTHSTKTRSEVRGGGKKPWRQKGTGRARHGTTRSPLWRGGGTVHGPKPRDYSYSIPRKVKKKAMRVALSEKLRDNTLTIVDELNIKEPKTREVQGLIERLEVGRTALFVDDASNENLRRASRNHPRVKTVTPSSLNVYDVLYYERLIVSKASLQRLVEIFGS
jgi:large subunit ribosomal protein L4